MTTRFDVLAGCVWIGCVMLGGVLIGVFLPQVDPSILYLLGAGVGGGAFQLMFGVLYLLQKRGDADA